jgi:simple sugar transport system ATP-binding protein
LPRRATRRESGAAHDGGSGDGAAVALRGITKHFGETVANDGVDFTLRPGTIHALLGENGAGKTTLMRILYGLARPDAGEILVRGRRVEIRSPKDAIAAGLGMVTQHFSLVAPMTVAENVALGDEGGFRLDRRAAHAKVAEASERAGIAVDPGARVSSLSVGEQQRVEIVKALSRDADVLILDEPTAVLVPQQVEALFGALRRLREQGLAVVFISHKLREVVAISDEVTVLRRGRVVATTATGETDERELGRMMVGRPTAGVARAGDAAVRDVVLSVERLSATDSLGLAAVRDVSFEVRGGEILGVAGVSGNGQTELAEALSGMRAPAGGRITVAGRDVTAAAPAEVTAAGVGRIPENRRASIVGDLSVAYNLVLEELDAYRRGPLLDEGRIRARADELIARFDIRARATDAVGTLSGGNIQKVLLARVLAREPKVLVVAQPTQGLDVGATEYVHSQLLAQRAAGAAVLLVSEDLEELLALSDRLVVMYEGELVGRFDRGEVDVERLGLLMAGLREDAA